MLLLPGAAQETGSGVEVMECPGGDSRYLSPLLLG